MGNKLIKDIDEATWRKFVAYCKIKGVNVGTELANVIDYYLKKNLKEMLK